MFISFILESCEQHGNIIWRICIAWWRHQMETYSALLAFCVGNSPVTCELPAQRPVMQSFDVSLICPWINGWVNNREAGDLGRHCAHYDVIVMDSSCVRTSMHYISNLISTSYRHSIPIIIAISSIILLLYITISHALVKAILLANWVESP